MCARMIPDIIKNSFGSSGVLLKLFRSAATRADSAMMAVVPIQSPFRRNLPLRNARVGTLNACN